MSLMKSCSLILAYVRGFQIFKELPNTVHFVCCSQSTSTAAMAHMDSVKLTDEETISKGSELTERFRSMAVSPQELNNKAVVSSQARQAKSKGNSATRADRASKSNTDKALTSSSKTHVKAANHDVHSALAARLLQIPKGTIPLTAGERERLSRALGINDMNRYVRSERRSRKNAALMKEAEYVRRNFELHNNELYRKTSKGLKKVVTIESAFDVISLTHVDGGHLGCDETFALVDAKYYGIQRDNVEWILNRCGVCGSLRNTRPTPSADPS